jgi:hypothetical protein
MQAGMPAVRSSVMLTDSLIQGDRMTDSQR